MKYRELAGEKVSQLGFGVMRLPMQAGKINEAETHRMLHRAQDAGINYFDTAWVYHGGESELVLGRALKGSRRTKAFIATKSPVWDVKTNADFEKILDLQLEKLGTDYIDFYLLHALNAGSWSDCLRNDAFSFLEKVKKSGKVRHYGFSFHDKPEVFPPILSHHAWEFCQVQYNYLDQNPEMGHPGLDGIYQHKTGIIIMEPLRGGNLAGPMPASVQKLLDSAQKKRSPAEWALRWIWNRPEPGIVLSGMSTMDQVEENLKIAADANVGDLNKEELELIEKVRLEFGKLTSIPCTACAYCMPCPIGVDIPRNFAIYNDYHRFEKNPAARGGYAWIPENQRADACTACGSCLEKCPQQIDIPNRMKDVVASLA